MKRSVVTAAARARRDHVTDDEYKEIGKAIAAYTAEGETTPPADKKPNWRYEGACIWHLRLHCKKTGYQRELARRRNPIEKKLRKIGILPPIGLDYERSIPTFPVNCDIIYDYPRKRWYQYFHYYGYVIIPHYAVRYDHWRDTWYQFIGNDVKPTAPPRNAND